MALKDLLARKLTKKQLTHVPSSFDIIGSKEKAVAIIEIPDELKKKRVIIAKALMEQHKNVTTVLEKISPRSGIFRTYALKIITGEKDTIVVHKESGCRFMVDPQKVYFSPREVQERLRIVSQVKKCENIMVFFAGIGPFPIVLSKKTTAKNITGIELNPDACRYFGKNVLLNKVINVHIIHGDVTKKVSAFANKCDRVLMPLPETAADFLYEALFCLKKNGICNFYCFSSEDEIAEKIGELERKAESLNSQIKITGFAKVLPYGPRIWKYRIDFVKVK
jgi:tRNA (guanine37-N1)-methyltransferase